MALFVLMRTASPTDFINNLLDIQALYGCPTPEDSRPPVDSTRLGAPSAAGVEKTPTVYSHVNRLLDRIAAAAGIARCIEHEHNKQGPRLFFNPSTDDYSVNKILGGYDTITDLVLQDLCAFDSQERITISHLFGTYHNLQAAQHGITELALMCYPRL
ncbi:RxLR effector candidate protein [Phytophthora palmivora]|uniref:RxLR effector candidate protein n=1 Tax=Phytophthora palmivora TaxID=4796 RepID=A0A2P4XCV9_9STRA|nr:RxLR effector candidate protein [Phytophthora palmivora]